jgi:hypothetical protein
MTYQSERAYITRTMRSYERPKDFFHSNKWLGTMIVMVGLAILLGVA